MTLSPLTLTQILAEIQRSWTRVAKTDAERQLLKGLWEDLVLASLRAARENAEYNFSWNLEGAFSQLDRLKESEENQ